MSGAHSRIVLDRRLLPAAGFAFDVIAGGKDDFVALMEAPSEDVLARIALALASRGNVRTTTLKVFNETQYKAIIGKLP